MSITVNHKCYLIKGINNILSSLPAHLYNLIFTQSGFNPLSMSFLNKTLVLNLLHVSTSYKHRKRKPTYHASHLLHHLPNSTIARLHVSCLVSDPCSPSAATTIIGVPTRIWRCAFMRAKAELFVIVDVGIGVGFVAEACTACRAWVDINECPDRSETTR